MSSSFSVLMSIYYKETSSNIQDCLDSISKQTYTADEIIIIEDGALTKELYDCLDKWQDKLPVKRITLRENVGLAKALNEGLMHCSHEFVARMDSDDICCPERFEKQLKFLLENQDVSLCGSHIREFDVFPTDGVKERNVNVGQQSLVDISRRCPFNHMTVFFRKSAVIEAGGYLHLPFMEDYYLWLRMFADGKKMINLDETLVYARVGNGMLERRRGWIYAKSEMKILFHILRLGISRSPLTILLFVSRAFVRLLPVSFLSILYKRTRNCREVEKSN